MRVAFQIAAMHRKLEIGTRFEKLLDLFSRTKFFFIIIYHRQPVINPFRHLSKITSSGSFVFENTAIGQDWTRLRVDALSKHGV